MEERDRGLEKSWLGSLAEMPSASSGLQNDGLFFLLGFMSTAFAWSSWLFQRVAAFSSGPASPMQTQQYLSPPGGLVSP